MLRIIHDGVADSATVYLTEASTVGKSVRSEVCEVDPDRCAVVLDFDAQNKLLAIELLGASRLLPDETLTQLSGSGAGEDM
jgi:uncharacterized protein YuzE